MFNVLINLDTRILHVFSFLVSWGAVKLSPLGTSATNWHIVPALDDDDDDDDDYECGIVGGVRIGRVNQSTRRKPAPVPLCPPQIPHDVTWARTRAAAVGSRQLTAVERCLRFVHKPKKVHSFLKINRDYCTNCRSQWPRGLRHELSSLARTLWS
jgi:hypothetical protein